jgi:Rrf2 family protein
MDVIRRNTDYALRMTVELADRQAASPVSTKNLADRQNIPYHLACKLLQRLNKAHIVKSTMGPEGGFTLSKNPSKITVRQVVEAVQGPVRLCRCLFEKGFCALSRRCPINPQLALLQKNINTFLSDLTLKQLSQIHKRSAK